MTHRRRSQSPDKDTFLNPRSAYYGEFSPQNLAFNANLQTFSSRVSLICALETGGKLTPLEAYQSIQELWHQLKHSHQALQG